MVKKLAVLMPALDDFQSARKLITDLGQLSDVRIFVVIVDDGSLRAPITEDVFVDADVDAVILTLARNVGHQAAIATGLTFLATSEIAYDAAIVMDSDGEDDPFCIPDLVNDLDESAVDVVVARRGKRSEGLSFRIFYEIYKYIFLLFTGKSINFGNFMALQPDAVRRIVLYNSLWTHFAATVVASRLRLHYFTVNRKKRYFGDSKMNFFSLCLHGFRALMVFADDVLVRVGMASAAVAVLSMVFAAFAGLLKLAGIATPGWFSIAIGILFLVFLQTGTLTLISLLLSAKGKRDYILESGADGIVAKTVWRERAHR